MARAEIHMRRMILPLIEGMRDDHWEVDLWIFIADNIGEVVLETVCDNTQAAVKLVEDLKMALGKVEVIREGTT